MEGGAGGLEMTCGGFTLKMLSKNPSFEEIFVQGIEVWDQPPSHKHTTIPLDMVAHDRGLQEW